MASFKGRIRTVLAVALISLPACKDNKSTTNESAGKETGSAPAAAEAKPSNAIKASCDELGTKGICTDVYERAYLAGEDQVKRNCSQGTLQNQPCPTANLLGYCDVSGGSSPAYRIAYYAGAGKAFDAASAGSDCKGSFAGTFTTP